MNCVYKGNDRADSFVDDRARGGDPPLRKRAGEYPGR